MENSDRFGEYSAVLAASPGFFFFQFIFHNFKMFKNYITFLVEYLSSLPCRNKSGMIIRFPVGDNTAVIINIPALQQSYMKESNATTNEKVQDLYFICRTNGVNITLSKAEEYQFDLGAWKKFLNLFVNGNNCHAPTHTRQKSIDRLSRQDQRQLCKLGKQFSTGTGWLEQVHLPFLPFSESQMATQAYQLLLRRLLALETEDVVYSKPQESRFVLSHQYPYKSRYDMLPAELKTMFDCPKKRKLDDNNPEAEPVQKKRAPIQPGSSVGPFNSRTPFQQRNYPPLHHETQLLTPPGNFSALQHLPPSQYILQHKDQFSAPIAQFSPGKAPPQNPPPVHLPQQTPSQIQSNRQLSPNSPLQLTPGIELRNSSPAPTQLLTPDTAKDKGQPSVIVRHQPTLLSSGKRLFNSGRRLPLRKLHTSDTESEEEEDEMLWREQVARRSIYNRTFYHFTAKNY